VVVGAVYPFTGSQGSGGVDEFQGVQLAVDMVNDAGGVDGRRIEIRKVDAPSPDAAVPAIDQLASDGVRFVVGSYGSTVSQPAAAEAARKGMLFWETGAVGEMSSPDLGKLVFRVAPAGAMLGRGAVGFVEDRLTSRIGVRQGSLKYAVAYVDDAYGRSVAKGALAEIARRGLTLAADIPYSLQGYDAQDVAARIGAGHPDVLFVASYLQDAVALQREMRKQGIHPRIGIGTSSSYCMPEFGKLLGTEAVGLFASDKPDGWGLDPQGLSPEAGRLLETAKEAYEHRYGGYMSAPALAGFSAAWALFHHVMPGSSSLTPEGVAAAAQGEKLPVGSLPNGSGLQFGRSDSLDAGANIRASSVIWEWVGVNQRAVVWPPAYATQGIDVVSSRS
jgi:branched-chain amino acid transport system substrate-binding protein